MGLKASRGVARGFTPGTKCGNGAFTWLAPPIMENIDATSQRNSPSPGYLDRPKQEALVETIRPVVAEAPLYRAGHARHRQGDVRAHDQLWSAWLGDGQAARLSLSTDASGHRRASASDAVAIARSLEQYSRL